MQAPVAQRIEQWFPKPCAQVRFLAGVNTHSDSARATSGTETAAAETRRPCRPSWVSRAPGRGALSEAANPGPHFKRASPWPGRISVVFGSAASETGGEYRRYRHGAGRSRATQKGIARWANE